MVYMKGKLSILILVLLFGCTDVEQTPVNEQTYSQWVDSVSKWYVETYLSKKKSETAFDPEQLQSRQKQLQEYIEAKKERFDESWTTEQILDSLTLLPSDIPKPHGNNSFAGYLSQEREELKKVLSDRISGVHTNAIISSTPMEESTDQGGNLSLGKWFAWSIIAIALLFIIVKYRRQIIESFNRNNNHSMRGPHSNIDNNGSAIGDIENRIRKLERRIEQIDAGLMNIKSFLNQIPVNANTPSANEGTAGIHYGHHTNQQSQNSASLYANTINEGKFHQVNEKPNGETTYELYKISDKTVSFRVYPGAYAKVLMRPNFLEGCDVQRTGESKVEIIESGEAILDQGVWRITKRAKIKFV